MVVVTLLPRDQLAAFRAEMALPFSCCADPDAGVHAAYGLERAPVARLLGLPTIWAYVRLMLAGRRPLPPSGEDVRRLGGDFVLDGRGRVVFAHRSRHPADRPSVARLVTALESTGDGADPAADDRGGGG